MSMISSSPERPSRNDRAGSAGLRGARSTRKAGGTQDSGQGSVSKEEASNRLRGAQNLMPRPRPSKSLPLPPGLRNAERLMPPAGSFDRGAGQGMRESLESAASFFGAPGRVVQGAIEGGARAINPDFEMPDYSNAQIPGVDFMDFITGSGVRDQGRRMPMQRNIDPGTDAILRAIMMRMQGGQ
jgi:hypothetical protein